MPYPVITWLPKFVRKYRIKLKSAVLEAGREIAFCLIEMRIISPLMSAREITSKTQISFYLDARFPNC